MTQDRDSKTRLSELRRHAESSWALKAGNDEDISALSPEDVQKLVYELRVHQIEMEMQNEELRRTRQDLEASRDRYSQLYDFAPVGYFILDHKGVILEANLTACGLLGRARAFMIGKPFAVFVNEQDENTLYLHLRQVLETQSNQTCEIGLAAKDGSQIPVRLNSLVLESRDVFLTVSRTAVTDITERKHAEEALVASEIRYRSLFDGAQEGILLVDFDNGKILDANQYLEDMLGYRHEEFLEKDLWEVSPFQNTPMNKDAFTELQQKGYVRHEDLLLETSDGRSINVEFVANTYLVHGMIFIQCNISDVTDRRRAEKALRESEELYRLTISSMTDTVLITDCRGDFTYVSPNTHIIFGYSQKEVEALGNVNNLLDDNLFDPSQLESLGEIRNLERTINDSHGKEHSLLVNVKRVDIMGGKILYTCRDITERRRGEETALLLAALVESSDDAIMSKTLNGSIVSWNDGAARLYGYKAEEVVGQPISILFPPERFDDLPDILTRIARGEAIRQFETKRRTKDRRILDVSLTVSPVKNSAGRIAGASVIARDITDRKISEALVRIRLKLLEFAVSHSLDELLQKTLDEVASWTDSPIAFYHFISEDEKTIYLQMWSSRTMKEFCTAGGKAQHYPVDQGGVWVDAIRERRTVIHNDYATLPHRKGLPEGHAVLIRELVVPIMKSGRIVAMLGIGNKPTLYTEKDVEIVSYLADVAWEIAERKRAEESRDKSKQQYRTLFEESIDGVYSVLRDGTITDANRSFCELFGYTREEMIGKDIRELYLDPADRPRFQKEIEKSKFVKDYEVKFRKRDGKEIDSALTSSVHFGKDGSITGYQGILRDLTARKELRRQLQQAQKMEAVGTLAGGIAHDFNNILQVALGYSELILAEEGLPQRYRADLKKIHEASRCGADLVQRLLTFSSKTEIKPRPINLNSRIKEMRKMIERTIPKMIDIEINLAEDLATINADPTQVDQVLMNLAVNARDAMPDGGKLIFDTANTTIDEEYAAVNLEAEAGSYVRLSVSDTGSGMDKETVSHIFVPFFTTKKAGEGTGLGLAVVFGIVKQHGGLIKCYSEPCQGTTFKIYFPALVSDEEAEQIKVRPLPRGGSETILVVDDEDLIRDLGCRILKKAGYKVFKASNGKEALDVYQLRKDEIALVILDLMMPDMGGKQCLEALLALDPSLKVVIASGFSTHRQTKETIASGAKEFIHKPYDIRQVLEVVREVLDAE